GKRRRWTLLARHLVWRLVVQQRIDSLALVFEFRQRLALQRFAARQADAQRIDLGDKIRQGQVIGWVGTTGESTGPNLHYELIVNGTKVDP
ncbi:M23 family metallopeptidase, partial [Rhizobium ruizarguesonis]